MIGLFDSMYSIHLYDHYVRYTCTRCSGLECCACQYTKEST
jgi:hypothetical protein